MHAWGSRPDSPGIRRDVPRGTEIVDDAAWEKSLLVHRECSAVLHVRRLDSPWGRCTVTFRDLLRADPEERKRYEALKRRLAVSEAGKHDYDDYTRAKTSYFDTIQTRLDRM